ncbi:hypothetical protein ABW20_dc0101165 [Dactylellina cionopaga]|nr:hypothetical protein ABW20_dc0101165 [Dactylellina cionopaga]
MAAEEIEGMASVEVKREVIAVMESHESNTKSPGHAENAASASTTPFNRAETALRVAARHENEATAASLLHSTLTPGNGDLTDTTLDFSDADALGEKNCEVSHLRSNGGRGRDNLASWSTYVLLGIFKALTKFLKYLLMIPTIRYMLLGVLIVFIFVAVHPLGPGDLQNPTLPGPPKTRPRSDITRPWKSTRSNVPTATKPMEDHISQVGRLPRVPTAIAEEIPALPSIPITDDEDEDQDNDYEDTKDKGIPLKSNIFSTLTKYLSLKNKVTYTVVSTVLLLAFIASRVFATALGLRDPPIADFDSYIDLPIIAVMGETGAGKSSFIKLLGGRNKSGEFPEVSDKLKSMTKEVCWYKAVTSNNNPFYILDTPGFDDTYLSDFEILESLAKELSGMYRENKKLNGVVYLHEIGKTRVGGSSHKSLRTFQKLIGDTSLKNVVLATTHWGKVTQKLVDREEDLKNSFWRGMSARGSRIVRHHATKTSALSIVESIIPKEPVLVKLVEELVLEGLRFEETGAGKIVSEGLVIVGREKSEEFESLNAELSELREKQRQVEEQSEREIQRVAEQFKQAAKKQQEEAANALKEADARWEQERRELAEVMASARSEKDEITRALQELEKQAAQEKENVHLHWNEEIRRQKEASEAFVQGVERKYQEDSCKLDQAREQAESEKLEVIETIKKLEEANERLQAKIEDIQNPTFVGPNIRNPQQPPFLGFHHTGYKLLDYPAIFCWYLLSVETMMELAIVIIDIIGNIEAGLLLPSMVLVVVAMHVASWVLFSVRFLESRAPSWIGTISFFYHAAICLKFAFGEISVKGEIIPAVSFLPLIPVGIRYFFWRSGA